MRRKATTRQISTVALAVTVSVIAAACAGGGSSDSSQQPVRPGGYEEIHDAVEDARERADDQPVYAVPLRYNEAHCGAPSFEIHAYGRWTRIFLEGETAIRSAIEDVLTSEAAEGELRSVTARGDIIDQRKTSGGVSYPVFEVQSFDEPVSDESALLDSRPDARAVAFRSLSRGSSTSTPYCLLIPRPEASIIRDRTSSSIGRR